MNNKILDLCKRLDNKFKYFSFSIFYLINLISFSYFLCFSFLIKYNDGLMSVAGWRVGGTFCYVSLCYLWCCS
jgi:hypothetical protein